MLADNIMIFFKKKILPTATYEFIQLCLQHLLKRLLLFYGITFVALQKSTVCLYVGLFLDSLFWSINLFVCLQPRITLLCLLLLYNESENQTVLSLRHCSFSELFWLDPVCFYINFRIRLSISTKSFWDFNSD